MHRCVVSVKNRVAGTNTDRCNAKIAAGRGERDRVVVANILRIRTHTHARTHTSVCTLVTLRYRHLYRYWYIIILTIVPLVSLETIDKHLDPVVHRSVKSENAEFSAEEERRRRRLKRVARPRITL